MRLNLAFLLLASALLVESIWAQQVQQASRGPSRGQRGPFGQFRQVNKLRRNAANAVTDLWSAQRRIQTRAAFAAARAGAGYGPLANYFLNGYQYSAAPLYAPQSLVQPQVVFQQQPQVLFNQQPLFQQAPYYDPLAQFNQLNQFAPISPLAALSPYQLGFQAQQAGIPSFQLAQAIAQAQQQPLMLPQIASPLGLAPYQLSQLSQQALLAQQQQGLSVYQLAQQATYGFGPQFAQFAPAPLLAPQSIVQPQVLFGQQPLIQQSPFYAQSPLFQSQYGLNPYSPTPLYVSPFAQQGFYGPNRMYGSARRMRNSINRGVGGFLRSIGL